MTDKILELPEKVQKIINRYKNLNLGDKKVKCPYAINIRKGKDLRAMVGKGTPGEIEMEAQIWAKIKGMNYDKMNEDQIREFLLSMGIGIDCSGFVIHILNKWYELEKGKSIWKCLKPPYKSLLYRISYFLKPVEKLGVEAITNDENSMSIEIENVKPGDVIKSTGKKKNAQHIMLVSKVAYDDSGIPKTIEYTHSTENYGKENGIRIGLIKITDITKPLQEQNWLEADENGVNHTLEGFMKDLSGNGLRRIKCLETLISENI